MKVILIIFFWQSLIFCQSIVSGFYPHRNANYVPNNTSVVIWFTEDMDEGYLNFQNIKVYGSVGGEYECNYDYDIFQRKLTLTPSTNFILGDLIKIQLNSSIRTITGIKISPICWTFKIASDRGFGYFGSPEFSSLSFSQILYAKEFDINHDNLVDIAIATRDQIILCQNDGVGNFGLVDSFQQGSFPRPFFINDFDRDKMPDILIDQYPKLYFIQKINDQWLVSDSLENYANAILAVDDFTGDLLPDIALTTNDNNGNVVMAILKNNGNFKFSMFKSAVIPTPFSDYSGISVDINLDNYNDIILSVTLSQVIVLINDGSGAFVIDTTITVQPQSYHLLKTGNINRDSTSDLIVDTYHNVAVYSNLNGILSNTQNINSSFTPQIELGYFDNDMDLDLLLIRNNYAKLYLNDGNGLFKEGPGDIVENSGKILLSADFDSDGDIDIISSLHDRLFILINGGAKNGYPRGPFLSIFFVSEIYGWAAGVQGKIVKSTDGGNSWSDRRIPNYLQTLNCIFFCDNKNGWVVGNWGGIFKSTDAGDSWYKVSTGFDIENTDLSSIFFVNCNNGWISDRSGNIIITNDGGSTWERYFLDNSGITSIYRVNDDIGWALTVSGKILKTVDGGENWVLQYTSETFSALTGISFADEDNGWVVGNSGKILHTSTGGANWESQDHLGFYYTAVSSPTPLTCYVIGNPAGIILKTTDGGENWIENQLGITANSIFLFDSLHGWVTGSYFFWISNGELLPVELISFNALHTFNKVELAWTTVTESNNKVLRLNEKQKILYGD